MAIKQSIEPAFDEAKLDNKGESARKCVSNCTAEDAIAAGKAARQAIQSLYKDSQLFSKKPEFTFYDRKHVKMGKRLGEGGFCVVRQVDGVPLMPAEQGEGDGKKQMLAVKHLKHSVMLDPKKFQLGAADLAIEANFLAVLNHENILKLHGVAAGPIEACVASSRSEEDCGYFIIVDRIVYTLQRKIEIWRRDNDELNGDFIARMMPASFNRKRTSLLAQRLETALRISDAMAHIHAKRIVYRDLKVSYEIEWAAMLTMNENAYLAVFVCLQPENIGFDAKGNVKLFGKSCNGYLSGWKLRVSLPF
jgi:serine/threonine protein kinase